MFKDWVIREAVSGDAGAIFAAQVDSVKNLCSAAYSEAQMSVWFEGRTPEIHMPSIVARQMWVAERNGVIMGFVGFVPGEVTVLFVRKDAASGGLGSYLFQLGLRFAQADWTGPIMVYATKNSQGFYESHGLKAVENDYFVRGEREVKIEVVKMEQDLSI